MLCLCWCEWVCLFEDFAHAGPVWCVGWLGCISGSQGVGRRRGVHTVVAVAFVTAEYHGFGLRPCRGSCSCFRLDGAHSVSGDMLHFIRDFQEVHCVS